MAESIPEKIEKLEKEEQELINGPVFSQDDADRQQEINDKIEELKSKITTDKRTADTIEDPTYGSAGLDNTEVGGSSDDEPETSNPSPTKEVVQVDTETGEKTRKSTEEVSKNNSNQENTGSNTEENIDPTPGRDLDGPVNNALIEELYRQNNTIDSEEAGINLDNPPAPNNRKGGEYGSGTNIYGDNYLDRDTNVDVNPGESLLRTGIGVMQFGQDNLQDPVQNLFDSFDQPRLGQDPIYRDRPTENEITDRIQRDRKIEEVKDSQIGSADEIIGATAGGAATGGTQLGGLAIAAPGATATSLRDDTPGFFEGFFSGPGLVKDEFTDNPGEFVASEVGEEIGESIVFGAATGGLGIAASAVPTPDPTVNPDSPNPSEGFQPDNNKPDQEREFEDATAEDVPQLQDNSLDREPDAPLQEDPVSGLVGDNRIGTEPGQGSSSAPFEEVDGLTIGDIEALAGREITPAERADIEARLQQENFQRVGNVREVVRDVLDGNTMGSGVGAFAPSETIQEPDIEFEEDFVENDLRQDPLLGQDSGQPEDIAVFDSRPKTNQPDKPGFDSDSVVDDTSVPGEPTALDPDISEDQGPVRDQIPGEDQGPEEQQPLEFEEDQQPENPEEQQPFEDEPSFDSERIFEPDQTQEIDFFEDSRGEPSLDSGFNEEENNGEDNLLGGLVSDEEDFKFETSVAADLLGLEGVEESSKESAGNPFNLRPGTN